MNNIMENALNVKDFVIDISQEKEKIEKRKEKHKENIQPIYNVVLQNNTDFVINRKTSTTDKNFVFLISQNNFYIKDNKTDNVENLTEQRIKIFFQPISGKKFESLDKVEWWFNNSLRSSIERMIEIINFKIMQKMYQHNIFVDRYRATSWEKSFNNNIKLFKYCYDKCRASNSNNDSFDNILKFATEIEKEINFNNAVYFIDKFCESNVKMHLQEGYSQQNLRTFINVFKQYNLDFSRYIDYLCFDFYTQGVRFLEADILNEYQDYLRMQISVFGKIKEKYPKYLRTEHDIISLKLSILEKHKKELLLINVTNNYKHLEYEDKNYCIVLPQTSMDIVDEGINQSHCVASYIDKVANNETMVVFMRNVDDKEKSLITIEVKDNSIKQAKGFANRTVNDEEKKFLRKWAKEKELHISL